MSICQPLQCFGSNEHGQLGTGDAANRGDGTTGADMGDLLPDVDLGTGAVATAVSAGWSHTCALLEAGTVKCWGRNDYGQLGQGDYDDRGDTALSMGNNLAAIDLGTTPGGVGSAVAVAVTTGQQFTCVLLEGGSVVCFGRNDEGQCGRGGLQANIGSGATDMGDSLQLVDLGTGVEAVSISSGTASTCATLISGGIKCWGGNNYGGLGVGDSYNRGDEATDMGDNLPEVDLGTGAVASSVYYGLRHVCAILVGGKVKCWGDNRSGQLGLGHVLTIGDDAGEMGDKLASLDLGTGGAATRLALGESHTCALLSGDGSVRCWGKAFYGQLGDQQWRAKGKYAGEMGDGLSAVSLGTGKSAAAIATGWDHTCAVLNDGGLKCWGLNTVGSLGLGDTRARGDDTGEMGDGLSAVSLGTGITVLVEALPTLAPTASPTASPAVSVAPSPQPSVQASPKPSQQLSPSPTESESPMPTPVPSAEADARSIGGDTPAPTEEGTGDAGTAGASGNGTEGGVLSSVNIRVAAFIAAPLIAIALLACFCARRRYRQVDAVSASVGARGGAFGKGGSNSSLGSGGGGGGRGAGLRKQHSDKSADAFGGGVGGAGNGHADDLSYGGSASAAAAAALAAAAAATQVPISPIGGGYAKKNRGGGGRGSSVGGGGGGGGRIAPHDYAPSYGPETAFAVTSRAGGGGIVAAGGGGEESDVSDGGRGGVGGGTDTGRSNSPSEAEDGDAGYGAYGSESAYVSSPGESDRDTAAGSVWRSSTRGTVHPEPPSYDELRRKQDRDQYEAEQDEEQKGGGGAGGASSSSAPAPANAVAGVPNSSSYFVRERNSDRILARSTYAGRAITRRGEVHTAIANAANASRDDRRNVGGGSPNAP